jgi:hypothetical protein
VLLHFREELMEEGTETLIQEQFREMATDVVDMFHGHL